jgi:D-glycero-D-manno-heptose 1,7-bisphosphate phosphatase
VSSAPRQPSLRPAVFLDRDGTLIDNPGDLGDPDRVVLLPGAADGLRQLRDGGFELIVVTNQGGVARGKYDEAAVARVHERLERLLRERVGAAQVIRGFYFCPFHPQAVVASYRGEHPWRKPAPGMLLHAAQEHALDLPRSWMVGDQERDVQAGAAAGCRTVLLSANREHSAASGADFVERDLPHAARRILSLAGGDAARESGAATLLPRRADILADEDFREAVRSMARGLAERTGIALEEIEIDARGVTVTVAGGPVIALGFAAELRRDSERWWRSHRAAECPWGGA